MAIIRKPRQHFTRGPERSRRRADAALASLRQTEAKRTNDPLGDTAKRLGLVSKIADMAMPVLDTAVGMGSAIWDALDGDEAGDRRKAAAARLAQQQALANPPVYEPTPVYEPGTAPVEADQQPIAEPGPAEFEQEPEAAPAPPPFLMTTPDGNEINERKLVQSASELMDEYKAGKNPNGRSMALDRLDHGETPLAKLYRARLLAEDPPTAAEGAAALMRLSQDARVGRDAATMFKKLPAGLKAQASQWSEPEPVVPPPLMDGEPEPLPIEPIAEPEPLPIEPLPEAPIDQRDVDQKELFSPPDPGTGPMVPMRRPDPTGPQPVDLNNLPTFPGGDAAPRAPVAVDPEFEEWKGRFLRASPADQQAIWARAQQKFDEGNPRFLKKMQADPDVAATGPGAAAPTEAPPEQPVVSAPSPDIANATIAQLDTIPIVTTTPADDVEFLEAWNAAMGLASGKKNVDMKAVAAFFGNEVYQRKALQMGMSRRELEWLNSVFEKHATPVKSTDDLVAQQMAAYEQKGQGPPPSDPNTLADVYAQLKTTTDPARQAYLMNLIQTGGVSGVHPRTLRELLTGSWKERAAMDAAGLVQAPAAAKPMSPLQWSRARHYAAKEHHKLAQERNAETTMLNRLLDSQTKRISTRYGDLDSAGRVYGYLNAVMMRAAKRVRKGRRKLNRKGTLWALKQEETASENRWKYYEGRENEAKAALLKLNGTDTEPGSIAFTDKALKEALRGIKGSGGAPTQALRAAEEELKALQTTLGATGSNVGTLGWRPDALNVGGLDEAALKTEGVERRGGGLFASSSTMTQSVLRLQALENKINALQDAANRYEDSEAGRLAKESRTRVATLQSKLAQLRGQKRAAEKAIEQGSQQREVRTKERSAILMAIGLPDAPEEDWQKGMAAITDPGVREMARRQRVKPGRKRRR